MSTIRGQYASIEINKQINPRDFKIPEVAQPQYLTHSYMD